MSGTLWFVGGVLGVILLVIWVITLADIFRRRHIGAGPTAAWAIIVLVLPFLGAAFYWARRQPTEDDVEYQASAERALRESHRSQGFDTTRFEP
jgi:phospholipase D-like protein